MRPASDDLMARCEKLARRIAFHGCETLVFLRPDGFVDSSPAFSPRAAALQEEGAAASAGFALVGVYRPGVSAVQLAADARETMR
ncbi:hypothetical protein [Thauera aminoaromatica]|uniref:hypothetical protein n=1 Tax=Thauera aminoaromatica TaxID=164330 RepID=UPI0035B36FCD